MGNAHFEYDPVAHLEHLGVRLLRVDPGDDFDAIYVHDTRCVLMRAGMSQRQERCVLAVQAVHAASDATPTKDDAYRVMREMDAEETAAWRLIPCSSWRATDGMATKARCDLLGVVPMILEARQRHWNRRPVLLRDTSVRVPFLSGTWRMDKVVLGA